MIEKLGSERMHQREGIVMCYPYQVLNTGNDINVNDINIKKNALF